MRDPQVLVATVIEKLEDLNVDEIDGPWTVTHEQVKACLEFVAESLLEREREELTLTFASWNQIAGWLRQLDLIRTAA